MLLPEFILKAISITIPLAFGASAGALPRHVQAVRPSEDAFYRVPADIASAAPGSILRQRKPPKPIAALRLITVNLQDTYQILYKTTDSLNNPTATVLTVLIPHNVDYTKVLSYQVAEDAATIDCAPSYALQLASAQGGPLGTIVTQAELVLIEASLSQGWVVILPDFEGPNGSYLANRLAGYATLDGIRAAINSANFTGVNPNPTVALWGYSGGSIASAWAAELQPEYAPELRIAGAALGGTVPDLASAINSLNKGALSGIILAGIQGIASQYPQARAIIQKHIKPQYADQLERAKNQCFVADVLDFPLVDVKSWVDDPTVLTTPPISDILNENSLGKMVPSIPLYIYKSFLDEVSPVSDTDKLVQTYCGAGASVEYVRDLLSEHGTLAVVGAPRALAWLINIMNGKAPRKACSTKNVLSSLLDSSTIEIIPKLLLDVLLSLLGGPVGPSFFG